MLGFENLLFLALALAPLAGREASPLSPEARGFDVGLSAPTGLRGLKTYYYAATSPSPLVTCHMAVFVSSGVTHWFNRWRDWSSGRCLTPQGHWFLE